MNTTPTTNHLVSPHGGKLINLLLNREQAADTKAASRDFASWDLTPRQLCDLELLLNGGFSPLTGFMKRDDYEAVCNDMHLVNGLLWPMPITLDVSEAFAKTLKPGSTKVALRDPEGVMIALLANLGLFLVLSFLRIDPALKADQAWMRIFADLLVSQVVLALIAPWFFAVQARLLEATGTNLRDFSRRAT